MSTITPVDTNNVSPDDLLTVSEVAKILRVDDTTVRRWIKTGAMEAVALPHPAGSRRNAYRVRGSTLLALLSAGQLPA